MDLNNPKMYIILKGKYHINFDENLIEILNEGNPSQLVKVESRFMGVLKILIESRGSVVPRETITEKVWDNYGGGDEGLTQAISFLRKTLDDGNRTLIETISKKGYKLNSALCELREAEITPKYSGEIANKLEIYKRLIWTGITIICLLVIFIVYTKFFESNSTTKLPIPDENQKRDSTSVAPQPYFKK